MKLFLLLISIHFSFLLNYVKSNQTDINDNASNDKNNNSNDSTDDRNKTTKTLVLKMNIYGHNVEVNFDQNRKIISQNLVDNDNANKAIKNNKLENYSSSMQKYPDYIFEVEPPNSNRLFSKRIAKRSDYMKSGNDSKDMNNPNGTKYLELAVFVDQKAYQNLLSNDLIGNETDFRELILCHINQIQAIYSHKSFSPNFFIHLVKIEFQKTHIFSKANGDRDELLKQFCEYQSNLNPSSDSDPLHWDMALLLTGYDLYVIKADGSRDYKSLGLGSVSGICTLGRNCVISEFVPINRFGELWPSSGLMSTWAAAHEMAHNLGILHDGWPFNTECPTNGYIMSGSRGTRGETNWSQCSANNFQQSYTDCLNDKPSLNKYKYDHNKYKLRPGAVWDSDRQCKLFLRDRKAFEFPKTKARICNETIFCATPNRIGFYSSGPALEGTKCGDNSWCVDGFCRNRTKIHIKLTNY